MQNDVVQQAISEQFNQCQCLETRGPVVGVGHCQGNSVIKAMMKMKVLLLKPMIS